MHECSTSYDIDYGRGITNLKLLKAFWGCSDNQIIEFAIIRARLNKNEKEVVTLMLDECMTQEEAAEMLSLSTRNVQMTWKAASNKLLKIEWVKCYAIDLLLKESE